MIKIKNELQPSDLKTELAKLWELSEKKIALIEKNFDPTQGAPVFTMQGRYTTRGWTEWTEGFQYGSALLQFDATGDADALRSGRENTLGRMSPHLTHVGVHDHGFNNISTYGTLLRLMNEGRIEENAWEKHFYELALKCSGAVQARRWTDLRNGGGFIYSFNGPHSLFADTIRSLRSLALGHKLGQVLMEENDRAVSLLERLIEHARATARYIVYHGEGRDAYDLRGRTVHEAIFNKNDGNFRCPSSQQGFSPFTTWTRGLAWVICGYPEQLEYLDTLNDEELEPFGGRRSIEETMLNTARAVCDFYIDQTPADGIPYWDTGAPLLHKLGDDYLDKPASPFNEYEPVDSSAAAIAAQGLLRLGHYLQARNEEEAGKRYFQAGLTTAETLLKEPYISYGETHQGLLLHSIYHRPNGWDFVPESGGVPRGESCMWGDYHLRELALYLHRIIDKQRYYTFFGPTSNMEKDGS